MLPLLPKKPHPGFIPLLAFPGLQPPCNGFNVRYSITRSISVLSIEMVTAEPEEEARASLVPEQGTAQRHI